MTDINKLRNQIDEIDSQLTELFQKRMETVEKVAEYKKLNGISTNDPSREQKIIEKHLPEVEEKWQPYYRDFQEELFVLSKKYQDTKNRNDDPFIRYGMDFSEYRDAAFNASQNARKAMARNPETVNGTVGSLCGDDGTIIAFDSVYDAYDRVPNKRKASYAGGIQGNPDFNETVFSWLNRLNIIRIPHRNVATPGGTGAISLAVTNLLDKHETLLIPSIAWGSYRVMAGQHDLKVDTYEIFENNEVSINGMKKKCAEMMEHQHKVVIIINDPCQNPTGSTMGKKLWAELIEYLNELSKQGPVAIINDIAYFDYAVDWQNSTAYMECFNEMSDNMLAVVCFSCSKTLTAYGMRVGNVMILARREEVAEHLYNTFIRTARASWSNVNNGFMDCFVKMVNENKEGFLKEKQEALDLLKNRSRIFLQEAEECGLPLYPYKEGFFATVRIDDEDLLNRYHKALDSHDIYTVKFARGIRVALCGIPTNKCIGLAGRMKNILNEVM